MNNIVPVPVNLSIVFQTVTEMEEEEERKGEKKNNFRDICRTRYAPPWSGNERIQAKTKA